LFTLIILIEIPFTHGGELTVSVGCLRVYSIGRISLLVGHGLAVLVIQKLNPGHVQAE